MPRQDLHQATAPALLTVDEATSEADGHRTDAGDRLIPTLYINQPLVLPDRRPRQSIVSVRPRDTQRRRLYRWERSQGAHGDTLGRIEDLEGIAAWVRHVWDVEAPRYCRGVHPVPAVAMPRSNQRHAKADFRSFSISIPRKMRTRWIILHEVAHHLAGTGARHGSVFAGVLIGLLGRHLSLQPAELVASAATHGVSVDIHSLVGPPAAAGSADSLARAASQRDATTTCG